ncbi:MAG: outer membrane beta-barrel protein [Longimicrobiales bacterium]
MALGKTIARLALMGSACLGGFATASAQVVGIKGGPTFSTVESDVLNIEDGFLGSWGAGLFIRFPLGRVTVQPEWLFINKGAHLVSPGDERNLDLLYNELHLLVRLQSTARKVAPYLMLGPTFSFEWDCEVEIEVEGDEDHFECDEFNFPIITDRKSRDLGLTGVLGAQIRLGPGSAFLEGRGTYGLTNVSDQEGVIEGDLRNRYFAIFIGYSYALWGENR